MGALQDQNKALLRELVTRLDAGDKDVVREIYSEDVIFHFPGGATLGFDDIVEMVDDVYAAFPDFTHQIDDVLAEGDMVVARLTDSGTHLGVFEGAAPTGNPIR